MGRGPQGFDHARRLADKRDFDRVFAAVSVRLSRHPFLLLAAPPATDDSRLGMVVGKRHARRAVERNRIRRQVRESFRKRRFEHPYDLIVLARPGAADCSNAQLAASLDHLWACLDRAPRRDRTPEGAAEG